MHDKPAKEETEKVDRKPFRSGGGRENALKARQSAGEIISRSPTIDITERKRMEEKLHLIQFSIDHASEGITWFDTDARIVYANDEECRRLGYSREELLNMTVFDIDPTVTPKLWRAHWEKLRRQGAMTREAVHRSKNGEIFPIESLIKFIRFNDKEFCLAFSQDITERKQAERARLANLKYFESMDRVNRAIQEGANDLDRIMEDVLDVCLSVFDCDRAFLFYPCDPDAPSWRVPMERSRPEFPAIHSPEETIPMDSHLTESLRTVLAASGPVSFNPGTAQLPPKELWEEHGIRSQMLMSLHPKVGKPWVFGLHQCADVRVWTPEEEDLLEKIGRRLSDSLTSLLMFRNLRKSEEFLNSIVENIPNAVFVKDSEELRFLRINRAGEKLLGFTREELIGKNSFELAPEEQAGLYEASDRQVLAKGVPVDIPEETIRNRAGEPRIVHTKKIPLLDDTGKPQHLLGISEDITDFKKLQAQLSQAQKIEALGAMSGGIAHDFNNILQPMLGYCELLRQDLPPDSPLQKFVEGIFNSGLRAKGLVNQILAFSRQSDRRMIPVEMQLILKEAVKLCRSIIPSNIEISQDIEKDCPPVPADPTQMHQIIMNLMINAYHAMEETGGKISVGLKETQLAADDLKGFGLQPGGYVRLSVSDTGCGIAPADLDKIFEPYFTTKEQGKGTGLGLAVVYGIVKEHGGHITVYSEVGKGATFNVYLPQTEKTSEALTAEKPKMSLATGSEHILLVDDEEMIVQLECQMLERIGYRVTSKRNGAEALALFRASPNAFDLVITDMNMPNMTGDRLARELTAIRSDVPIIICTGFSEKIGADEAKALGVKEFLIKPITISEMTRKVRKVLDEFCTNCQ